MMRLLFRRKTLGEFFSEEESESSSSSQKKESGGQLSLFDLLCIGIGGTVGSGVFVLTGEVYPKAGPSAALCWIIGAGVCLLSALSYMELSARVPTKGSTYAYAYHALGEFAAVAGATSLTLEYGLSGAGVARSWSGKVFGIFPSAKKVLAVPYGDDDDDDDDRYLDFCAAGLQLLCALVCLRGFNLSKRVVNFMTVAKVALVLFLIVAGFAAAGGRPRDFDSSGTFFAKGASGVATGTSLLFFGFIGFDEVCCMAARSKDPRKTLPRAIAGTLFGAALLSTLAQLALAGIVVAGDSDSNDSDSEPTSFEKAFRQRGWIWAKYAAEVGEVALLPLVVLLSFMPQPELMAALGCDGVVSRRFTHKSPNDVYVFGCVACGVILVVITLVVPFAVLWNVINLGVLLGFNVSNAALISVRLGNGGRRTNQEASLVLNLYVCVLAPLAAYLLWKGALGPLLENQDFDFSARAFLVVGLALFTAACLAVKHLANEIDRRRQGTKTTPRDRPREEEEKDLDVDDVTAVDRTGDRTGDRRLLEIAASSELHAPFIDDDDDRTFRAPGVPYVPAAAVFLNFLLMAQYKWIDHLYLLALYGTAYAGYFAAKQSTLTRGKLGAKCDCVVDDDDDERNDPTDSLDRPLLT